jgi:hypothetical protein
MTFVDYLRSEFGYAFAEERCLDDTVISDVMALSGINQEIAPSKTAKFSV